MASAIDLAAINSHLRDKSYVNDAFEPTQADLVLFDSLKSKQKEIESGFPYLARWFDHISSFDDGEKRNFTGTKTDLGTIIASVMSR